MIMILILNLTVSVGTMNGLVCYVNDLLAVGGEVFFAKATQNKLFV